MVALSKSTHTLISVNSSDFMSIAHIFGLIKLRSHFQQIENERDVRIGEASACACQELFLIDAEVIKLL